MHHVLFILKNPRYDKLTNVDELVTVADPVISKPGARSRRGRLLGVWVLHIPYVFFRSECGECNTFYKHNILTPFKVYACMQSQITINKK